MAISMATVKLREPTDKEKEAIHFAAVTGDLYTIQELTSSGVDVTGIVADEVKWTALQLTGMGGRNDIVTYLLSHGARVNDIDNFRRTALHWAAWRGHTDIVYTLVKNGASVNIKDEDNRTPLKLAVEGSHCDVVHYFMKHYHKIDTTQFNNETLKRIIHLLLMKRRDDKPDIQDLPNGIVRLCATEWENLGIELGLKEYYITKISEDNAHHPRRMKMCFIAMLEQWTKMSPSPTWGKVDDSMKKIYILSLKVQNYNQTDNLWTQQDLEHIIVITKQDSPLPKDIEVTVLQSVMVLLIAININEISAAHSYLQPLDGHENIYQYFKTLDQKGQQTKVVTYYIGKYGACTAAIRNVPAGVEGYNSTLLMTADQCFPNLSAIISVGVACGIKKEVKLCDVLVSTKVISYDKGSNGSEGYLPREATTVSPQIIKLFTQCKQWPNDAIRKRLNDNKISIPNVKSGIILNGPYYVDDPVMKTALGIKEAIGIEMERTGMFTDTQQSAANSIIVKAVCDFGHGKYNKIYQPTAALIAADLVYKCLSDPLAYEMFKGKILLRQMLQQAKNEGLTINVRHAKILFCGASCAGKTSFSRLLRNQKHKTVYESTDTGNAQQVLLTARVNVEGEDWISLDGELETQELTKRLILKLQDHESKHIALDDKSSSKSDVPAFDDEQVFNKIQSNSQTVAAASYTGQLHAAATANLEFKENVQESHSFGSSAKELSKAPTCNENVQTNESIGIEEKMVAFTDSVSESVPKTWDLFTLLDTGGQPEFINMLPAINSSTAITFVVVNISSGKKCLQELVAAQYKREGYNYSEGVLKYTNIHLLKCLLSSIKVAAMKKDTFHADVIKQVKEGKQSQPIVCIIGTCADVLKKNYKENYNDEIHAINEEVKKLVETIQKEEIMVFWCDAGGNYVIPIDNTISRQPQKEDINEDQDAQTVQQKTAQNIKIICEHSNEILREKNQYEIPISWFILELELRNSDKDCIPLTEVKDICDRILPSRRKMNIEEIKEVLKFYHLCGMLLYFSEVDGMKEFVITNLQWFFINLSKIIMCKFENNANDLYGAHHIKMMHNGTCHIELLGRLKLDLQGIELESFVKLLVHLKIIAPIMDDTYFMPTILPLCNEKNIFTESDEYGKPTTFALDGTCQEVKPLLIEFTFGTIPRGLFGFLIVQLLQDNHTFELYGKNDRTLCRCADLITFYMKPCYYVSLHDKISYLELQVRVKGNEPSCHYQVQTVVTEALEKVCDEFSWRFSDCRYGFLCHHHGADSQDDHLTLLSAAQPIPDDIPKYAYCKNQQSTLLNETHNIWLEQELQKTNSSGDREGGGNSKPTIKQLMKYIGKITPQWNSLGMQLLEDKCFEKLKIIEKNYPTDSERGCTEMFMHWLNVDTEASWKKLIDALEQIGQNILAEKIKEDVLKGSAPSLTRQQLPQQEQSCICM